MSYPRFVVPQMSTGQGKQNPAEKEPGRQDVPQPPDNPGRKPPLYVAPKL